MSGKDERRRRFVDECPMCKFGTLGWTIISDFPQDREAFFNCTDVFGGPDYILEGPLEDIKCFKCYCCRRKFKPGSNIYVALMRDMRKACHVRDNSERRYGTFEWER